MNLSLKLEILIRRKGVKKSEFADSLGITYRALANYIAGARTPRKEIFRKMADELGTTVEFLRDDRQSISLNSEERFIFNATSDTKGVADAENYLQHTKGLFAGNQLTEEDKQALFTCLTEIYFDAKEKAKKYGTADPR